MEFVGHSSLKSKNVLNTSSYVIT